MHHTDKFDVPCRNCGSTDKWMIETHMMILGYNAFIRCDECYDGAPDANMEQGSGPSIEEALADWQSNFFEAP